jgi:uncharacterized protein (DUF486 family)
MNQQLTPREKSILTAVAVVIGLALMSSMTSCSVNRYGMTNCDAAKYKMCGYR